MQLRRVDWLPQGYNGAKPPTGYNPLPDVNRHFYIKKMVPFEKATLAEKQMYYYNGAYCIYCQGETDLVDSICVYQESHGLIYRCSKCNAHVGVHGGSLGDQSLGTVAKKALRDLRSECHKYFDPLWRKRMEQGVKIKAARAGGYAWLAKILGIETCESHIGYFNEEQCKIVIAECLKHILTPEQVKEKQKEKQFRVDTIYFLSGELDYPVKEFKMNNQHKIELKHHEGKVFIYDVTTKQGA